VESSELKEKKEDIEAEVAIEAEVNLELKVKKADIEAEAAIEAEENPEVKVKKVLKVEAIIEEEAKVVEEEIVIQEKKVKTKITLTKTKSTLNSSKELITTGSQRDIRALPDLLILKRERVELEEGEKFLRMATERVTGVAQLMKPELTLTSMLTRPKQKLQKELRRHLKKGLKLLMLLNQL
jgi:hypothetical protein